MAYFDMRGQLVTNQCNASYGINFEDVQNEIDLTSKFEKLKVQIAQAKDNGILPEQTVTDAEYYVIKAIQQAKKSEPDKKTLLDYPTINNALIESVVVASGLVTILVGGIQVVQKLF